MILILQVVEEYVKNVCVGSEYNDILDIIDLICAKIDQSLSFLKLCNGHQQLINMWCVRTFAARIARYASRSSLWFRCAWIQIVHNNRSRIHDWQWDDH